METERIVLNEARNVSLTAYLQPVGGEFNGIGERPAVLVIPGGGYRYCSDREADPVALAYLKAGYHAFVLRYSLGEHAAWPHPLEDYEQAMSLIREKAGGSVITLGSFLRFAKLSEAAVRDIEEKLRAIPKDTKEDLYLLQYQIHVI